MKLAKTPFEKIKKGQKIIESRLYDEKRQQINVGDRIKFMCNNNHAESITAKIKALYRYQSFDDLFSDYSPGYFGGSSKESLIKEIRKFYSIEEERRYGVIGIKLELGNYKAIWRIKNEYKNYSMKNCNWKWKKPPRI